MTRHNKHSVRNRGTALSELVVLLPFLIVMFLISVDFGRLVYANQVIVALTREAANLVSRGATTQEAFAATFMTKGEIDVQAKGGIIISEIRRKDAQNPTPWIVRQDRRGSLSSYPSRVGTVGGPARIPDVNTLPAGVAVVAVEIVHPFKAMFDLASLNLNFYPEFIYDAAFF
jgi:hypothetical protein